MPASSASICLRSVSRHLSILAIVQPPQRQGISVHIRQLRKWIYLEGMDASASAMDFTDLKRLML